MGEMKILLIDDEIDFCLQTRGFLAALGHEVHTESNGERAFERIADVEPDVLILDIDLGLAGIDGRAICARVARSAPYREGRRGIILVSGHFVDTSDEVLGLEIGADNYLVKPFELPRLAARVQALGRRIGTRAPAGDTVLRLGGELEIHLDRREARLAGEPLALSRLEFNVLAYLADEPGVVRTKAELLENVWSTPCVEEGAIAKCVSLLRRKLAVRSGEDYILTVHGVGYRTVTSAASPPVSSPESLR